MFAEEPGFEGYDVLVVPPLYVASDALLQKIADFAKAGGHVLLTLRSGFTNEWDTVRWTRAPGPLREGLPGSYQEFSSLKAPLPLKGDPFGAGAENKVSVWADMILPETAEPLAFYDHPFFGKYPALTRNAWGRGSVTYQGTVLSDTLQERVVAGVLKQAGIAPESGLPAKVRAREAVARDGGRCASTSTSPASRSRSPGGTAPRPSSCRRRRSPPARGSRWGRTSRWCASDATADGVHVSAALLDGTTAAGAVLVFSLVAALGLALGSVKVRGVGLGIAGVLFVGIAFGHFGVHVEERTRQFEHAQAQEQDKTTYRGSVRWGARELHRPRATGVATRRDDSSLPPALLRRARRTTGAARGRSE